MPITVQNSHRVGFETDPARAIIITVERAIIPEGARRALVFGGVAVAAAICGALRLFQTFQFYDDEGYFLLSLSNHAAGHALYDEVYAQYGPLYHQALGLIFGLLGVPFTHAAARIATLVFWTGTSVLCGVAALRLSRSLVAAAVAQILSFAVLSVLADEPLHPGALTCLLLAAAAALAASIREPSVRRLLAMGVLCGALLAIKANVGIFAVLAFATALVAAGPARWRLVTLVLCAALPVVPFALTRDLLGEDAVACHAAVVSLALVPVCVQVARRRPAAPLPGRAVGAGLAGIALVPAASIAACLIRGTTPAGLLEGILLGPMRLPGVFCVAMDVPSSWLLASGASLGLWGYAFTRECRDGAPPRLLEPARAAISFLALACLAGIVPLKAMFFALPFLWIIAPADGGFASTFLALAAGLQALHAFPVAGSQVAFATFLLAPLAVKGLWEGIQASGIRGSRWGAASSPRATLVRRVAATAALGMAVLSAPYRDAPAAWASYGDGLVDLDLPGTRGLRLPEWQVAAYQWVTANLEAHADTFVSLPGLNSFHLWSGVAPPTLVNATAWPILLDATTQERMARALGEHPRACALVQRLTAPLWGPRLAMESMPLARAIFEEFHLVGSALGYEFLVRKGREVALVHCASVVAIDGGAMDEGTRGGTARELQVRLSPLVGGRPARAVVIDLPTGAVLLDAAVPGEGTGRGRAAGAAGPSGRHVDGSPSATLCFPWPGALRQGEDPCLVRLLSAEGRRLASVPLLQEVKR